MEKLRIGIIGCGGIANGKHMPALKKLDDVEMVAFCDIIVERAEQAAKDYGIEGAKAYEDYNEMLAKEKLDIVHVCTPNNVHAPATVASMEAGCHVMCEKPAGVYTLAVRDMIAAADRHKDLTFAMMFNQRTNPVYRKMKEIVDADIPFRRHEVLTDDAIEMFKTSDLMEQANFSDGNTINSSTASKFYESLGWGTRLQSGKLRRNTYWRISLNGRKDTQLLHR